MTNKRGHTPWPGVSSVMDRFPPAVTPSRVPRLPLTGATDRKTSPRRAPHEETDYSTSTDVLLVRRWGVLAGACVPPALPHAPAPLLCV